MEPEVTAPRAIIATYNVKVTVRGEPGTTPPTITNIEETIEDAITATYPGADDQVMVRASAERTDR